MSRLTGHDETVPRPCPVCDAPGGEALARLCYSLFDDLNMSGEKTLLGCRSCGMLYDDAALTEEQLAEYYRKNEHYAASDTGGTGGVSEDNAARYERILSILAPGGNGTIVDVGCGQGGFVDHCRAKGLAAVGVEPSLASRAAASHRGLPVFPSFEAFRAASPGTPVEAVVLSHVLEHLLQPLALLKRAAQFAPAATIYLEVPDAASYLAGGRVRWPELYFEHLAHFRAGNLLALARRAGIGPRTAGGCSFSPARPDAYCCYLVGTMDGPAMHGDEQGALPERRLLPLITMPEIALPHGGRPMALWGVSQYAMLLLGSRIELAGVSRLFDSSPAKIGRSVRGVVVESSDALTTLSADTVLLIPQSPHAAEMAGRLDAIGFGGTRLIV